MVNRLSLLLVLAWIPSSFTVANCTDREIWSVFPESTELGDVNDTLKSDSKSVQKNGDILYYRSWTGGSSSRSVSIGLTVHGRAADARKVVEDYGKNGSGIKPVNIGDAGYWTDTHIRPYYLVCRKHISISFFSRFARSGSVGPQDQYLNNMIARIDKLPCMSITNQHAVVFLSQPSAVPDPVVSAGRVNVSASAVCSEGHPLSFFWTARNRAGSFADPTKATTTWQAPTNSGTQALACLLSCTAKCDAGESDTASCSVQVLPSASPGFRMTSGASGNPNPAMPGENVQCTVKAEDRAGRVLTYQWQTDGSGGTFQNGRVNQPVVTWIAPTNISSPGQDFKITAIVSCPGETPLSSSYIQRVDEAMVLKAALAETNLYLTGDRVVITGEVTLGGRPLHRADIQVKLIRPGQGIETGIGAVSDSSGQFSCSNKIPVFGDRGRTSPETWTYVVTASRDPGEGTAKKEFTIDVMPVFMDVSEPRVVQVSELTNPAGIYQVAAGRAVHTRVYVSSPSMSNVQRRISVPVEFVRKHGNAQQDSRTEQVELLAEPTPVDYQFIPPSDGKHEITVTVDPGQMFTDAKSGVTMIKNVTVNAKKMKVLSMRFVPVEIPVGSTKGLGPEVADYIQFCQNQVDLIEATFPLPKANVQPIIDCVTREPSWLVKYQPITYLKRYELIAALNLRAALAQTRWIGVLPDCNSWWGEDKCYGAAYYMAGAKGLGLFFESAVLVRFKRNGALVPAGVTAHELAHTLGLNRGTEEYSMPNVSPYGRQLTGLIDKGGKLYDLSDPDDLKASFGFAQPTRRRQNRGEVYCFMGFMPAATEPGFEAIASRLALWVCPTTYSELFTALKDPPPQPMYYVSGKVDKHGKMRIGRLYGVTAEPGPVRDGHYVLEAQSISGQSLAQTRFGFPDTKWFGLTMPVPDHAVSLVLKENGREIDRIERSASAPQVEVISPNGGENISGQMNITWAAADLDNDKITSSVLYSSDGGANWHVLVTDTPETSLAWDSGILPGGTNGLIKVVTTDGFQSRTDLSDAVFSVENKAPWVSIMAPTNGSSLAGGAPVVLSSTVFDLEDGLVPDRSVTWQSDQQGLLGSGARLRLEELREGAHTISVQCVDGAGNKGFASVMIKVEAPVPKLMISRGQSFAFSTPGGRTEIQIGVDAQSTPDIRLSYSTNHGLEMWFEGRWMRVGSQRVFGKGVTLKRVSLTPNGEYLWEFEHSMDVGTTRNLYIREGNVWTHFRTFVCQE